MTSSTAVNGSEMTTEEDRRFVSVRSVTKSYQQGKRTIQALPAVDLDIPDREFVCVIGASGCGKSTLLRLLAGLESPSTGTLSIFGQTPEESRLNRRLGLVFQEAVLMPWRTVEENIWLPLQVLGASKPVRRERAKELAALVGLEDYLRAFPHQLSGGMQQRVGIARALAHDPPLLLMDEPFGALDAMTRDHLNFELMRIWAESGKTIFFVTHDIEEAVLLADTIVVMAGHGLPGTTLRSPLPRPRDRGLKESAEFGDFARTVRKLLEEGG